MILISTNKTDIDNVLALTAAILFAAFIETFIFMLIFMWQLKRITTNHLYVLVGLILSLIGICLLVPAYLSLSIEAYLTSWQGFFANFDVGLLLLSFVGHPLVSHLFFAHVALILALVLEMAFANDKAILLKPAAVNKPKKKVKVKMNETVIGTNKRKEFATPDNAKHIFVCGTTGSGKTVLLANYIKSAIDKNYPLLVIDGKGDLSDGSLLAIIRELKGDRKLYLVSMSDINASSPYNPFKNASSTIVKDMLINLTTWSEEHYKANTERYIQKLVWLMERMNIPLSFNTLLKYFSANNFKELVTECLTRELITKGEGIDTLTIIKGAAEIAQSAAARFATLSESELGGIFADHGIDIFEALKENAIILFILNPLIYPEAAKALGRLILIDAKKAVSKLYNDKKERVFFLFDEINTYVSEVFIDLLNKSRSANVTCIAATQSLSDLDIVGGASFREQIIENCNNYVVLRQNSAGNAESWAQIFGTIEGNNITYQLGGEKDKMSLTGMGSLRKERVFIVSVKSNTHRKKPDVAIR